VQDARLAVCLGGLSDACQSINHCPLCHVCGLDLSMCPCTVDVAAPIGQSLIGNSLVEASSISCRATENLYSLHSTAAKQEKQSN